MITVLICPPMRLVNLNDMNVACNKRLNYGEVSIPYQGLKKTFIFFIYLFIFIYPSFFQLARENIADGRKHSLSASLDTGIVKLNFSLRFSTTYEEIKQHINKCDHGVFAIPISVLCRLVSGQKLLLSPSRWQNRLGARKVLNTL